MAVYKRDIVDINLETGNIHRSFLKHSIGYKDQKADHFGIRTYRDGVPVDLTGVSVQGIFLPPQGDPIAITSGNIVDGNVAEVVLPQACYNYDGQFTLSIKLVDSNNSVTGTMRIVDGMVDNTHASGTVAPTSAVPTYQEILSSYDAMVAATTAANTAATNCASIVAAAYSTSATYAVGDYCTKDGKLYRCTTAITTAESWTAGHWTETKVGPEVSDLKSVFDSTLNPVEFTPTIQKGRYIQSSNGQSASNNKYARTSDIPSRGYRIKTTLNSQTYSYYIAFYDADCDISTGAGFLGTSGGFVSGDLYIPANAVFFVLNFKRNDGTNMADSDKTAILSALSLCQTTDLTLTVSGKAADAKATGDIITEGKNHIDETLFSPVWEQGAVRAADGISGVSTNNSIYAQLGLPNSLTVIQCDSAYYFRVFCYGYGGWNDYLGGWTGSAYSTDVESINLQYLNFGKFLESHSEILFTRISAVHVDGSAILPSEGANVLLYAKRTKFIGKKFASLGDSITYGFIPRNVDGYNEHVLKSYANLTAQRLGMVWSNNGISGSSVAEGGSNPMVDRYNDLPNDADFISVMGGTNDARNPNTIPLGTMESRDKTSFYGALHNIFAGLYKKYFIDNANPRVKIFGITPIKLLKTSGGTEGGTGTCWDMEPYAEAFRKVANYYGFPCVDMIHECGINPELNQTVHGTVTGYTDWYNPYITDGTHPTQAGSAMMADVLCGFFETLI